VVLVADEKEVGFARKQVDDVTNDWFTVYWNEGFGDLITSAPKTLPEA
jgi:hypothetical protein